jgi:hypothetical protein
MDSQTYSPPTIAAPGSGADHFNGFLEKNPFIMDRLKQSGLSRADSRRLAFILFREGYAFAWSEKVETLKSSKN